MTGPGHETRDARRGDAPATRICLAGEDLDWLGGRCVCTSIDLRTTVGSGPGAIPYTGIYLDAVWRRLTDRPGPAPLLHVASEAPTGSGLSTSTSLVIALTRACLLELGLPAFGPDELIDFTYAIERDITRGGGMDHVAIVRGGTLYMDGRPEGPPAVLGQVEWPPEWAIVLIDSMQRKDSRDHLLETRRRSQRREPRLAAYIHDATTAADNVWNAVLSRDLAAACSAVNAAHEAMRDWQAMSTPGLERLRTAALDVGCPAVKLTGSGSGGCLFGVVASARQEEVLADLSARLGKLEPAPGVRTVRPVPIRCAA
ncbi:hypothetical protein [Dactylosporangium sp. CA-139066]|uniref:GHMP family kinase ATP-binding protein n=1 Tax=Dactylosporangium sp. CA-139066 TaxID=3239930 RepID=UPI003D8C300B